MNQINVFVHSLTQIGANGGQSKNWGQGPLASPWSRHCTHAFYPRHWWSDPTYSARHDPTRLTDIDSPAAGSKQAVNMTDNVTTGQRDFPMLNNKW